MWSPHPGGASSSRPCRSSPPALVLAVLTGRSIVRPIRSLTGALQRLAHDAKLSHIDGEERRDEIGEIARAVGGDPRSGPG